MTLLSQISAPNRLPKRRAALGLLVIAELAQRTSVGFAAGMPQATS